MADIDVSMTEGEDQYDFVVTVTEGRSETRHRVTLKKSDFQDLVGDRVSAKALVEESFRFLLEREPKESILRSFDLMVIGHYFPQYRREIVKRL